MHRFLLLLLLPAVLAQSNFTSSTTSISSSTTSTVFDQETTTTIRSTSEPFQPSTTTVIVPITSTTPLVTSEISEISLVVPSQTSARSVATQTIAPANNTGLSLNAIIGISVGSVFALLLIGTATYAWYGRKRVKGHTHFGTLKFRTRGRTASTQHPNSAVL